MSPNRVVTVLVAASVLWAQSCAVVSPPDYSAYRSNLPRSILVLPPLNQSVDVNAPYVFLSTVSRPLAECGYYVFPVAVVDAFMKENGLPTPDEMQAVPLTKVKEVIGADAVLYVTIEEWGQKYHILSSDTVVKANARLVDVASGTTLWTGTEQLAQSSNSGAGGGDPLAMLIAMLVNALVTQIVASMTDPTYGVSRQATTAMVFNANNGLLFGPRHPEHDADPRGR